SRLHLRSSLLFASFFFFSSRRRHTRSKRDWSSDVCSSDLSVNEILNPSKNGYMIKKETTNKAGKYIHHKEEGVFNFVFLFITSDIVFNPYISSFVKGRIQSSLYIKIYVILNLIVVYIPVPFFSILVLVSSFQIKALDLWTS